MSAESTALPLAKPRSYQAILWGGLLAGILDITAAFINSGLRGRSPVLVLQGIASGLLGANAAKGGMATAALGAAIHFFIAFTATTVFYVASRKLLFLTERAVLSGVLYGVAVYLFMYFIVLPLTFPSKMTYPLAAVIIAVLTHIFCVGLPISLTVRRYSK